MKQELFLNLPERLRGLGEIASSLWWSWPPATRMVFKMLDRQGWKDSGHNPVKMLKELPGEILESKAHDPIYYKVSDEGIPHEWVKLMKASIKSVAPRFCTRRMVKEYVERFYSKALKEA